MVDWEVFLAYVTYLGRFLGDKKGVGKMSVTYYTQVIITLSLLFRLEGKFHFLTKGFMYLSLFVRETSFQFFCHISKILRLMVRGASEDVVRFSFKSLWDNEASYAILSAFSLPGIPTWEGIHINKIVLLEINVSSWMSCTSSILE